MSSTTTIFPELDEKFSSRLQTVTGSRAIRFGFANRYGSFQGDTVFFVPIGRETEVIDALMHLVLELRVLSTDSAQEAAGTQNASKVVVTEGTVHAQGN